LGSTIDLAQEKSYPRGSLVSRNGEINKNVYIVSLGLLRVSACSESGKRITFLLVKKGEPYNLLSPFMEGPRILEAEAVRDSRCLVISGADYLRFLDDHPEVQKRVIIWIAPSLDNSSSRILDHRSTKRSRTG
jgi:CRP/FNR family transcriptional regulator, cyclic AMP receptor protein